MVLQRILLDKPYKYPRISSYELPRVLRGRDVHELTSLGLYDAEDVYAERYTTTIGLLFLSAVVQWNHACFGILEVSKRTGSNPVHGLSVDQIYFSFTIDDFIFESKFKRRLRTFGLKLLRAVTALGPARGKEVAFGSGLGPKAGPSFPWWPQASLLVVHLQRFTLGKGRHKQEINVYNSPDGAVRAPKGVIRATCTKSGGEWCVQVSC
ncbi:hypothetical protein E2C01_039813 [Portunus trituberculatus]|uniref:Uncharacterized protein n=1 Tax=Portunus trituberculatus TaxID=210409 RepID=A0A5B7FP11_PORTR|nr:hypothetical protein [Portunus trituberculatus]